MQQHGRWRPFSIIVLLTKGMTNVQLVEEWQKLGENDAFGRLKTKRQENQVQRNDEKP